jgi:hypothetical protein
MELRGRLVRPSWLGRLLQFCDRRGNHPYAYTIDWDQGFIEVHGQRYDLSAATGIWLTRFVDEGEWGVVSLTLPGKELQSLCSRSFATAQAFAEAAAKRCGCPLHRTN